MADQLGRKINKEGRKLKITSTINKLDVVEIN